MIYHRPENLQDCMNLLSELPAEQRHVLAGGTDLVPGYEQADDFPQHLIDIKRLDSFSTIQIDPEHVTIGSLLSIEDIQRHPLIRDEFSALQQATRHFAGLQIRNRATLGGNICNASPAGDTLPALYAFDAEVNLIGPAGKRSLPIAEFITGPGQTSIHADELLESVTLPRKGYQSDFYKLGLRDSMAISVVNLAIVFRREGASFQHLNLNAGSVAPTVVRLEVFQHAILHGQGITSATLALIDQDIQPIDDIRATAAYRSRVLKNICKAQLEDFLAE